MPKFLVEIVYAYEIEAESKDKAEQHGHDTLDYLFEDLYTSKYDNFNVRAVEVVNGLQIASRYRNEQSSV